MKARLPQGYGGGGMGNMNQMVRQAQKMQEEMTRVQAELEESEYAATSGGEAVAVVVSGKKEVKSVKIKPEVIDPDDAEMLEDLICAAVNEALRKCEEDATAKMSAVTGGMNIPGIF
ncbi:MAG: YbaB/EbfC family nucleoid-associated protein [Ruminococcaceae bacterium]|nr:YbaB/EbfC family nucleoid-associated protein [Oscillospiraceae bacterium]